MYYEEKIINGVLSYRHSPHRKWTPFTLEEMAIKMEDLKKEFKRQRLSAIRALGLGYLLD